MIRKKEVEKKEEEEEEEEGRKKERKKEERRKGKRQGRRYGTVGGSFFTICVSYRIYGTFEILMIERVFVWFVMFRFKR